LIDSNLIQQNNLRCVTAIILFAS